MRLVIIASFIALTSCTGRSHADALTYDEAKALPAPALASRLLGTRLGSTVIDAVRHDYDARLDGQLIVLARSATGTAGFMSLEPNGYIDFAYIRPSAQGTGLFRQLYAWIAQRSLERGDGKLWVHASLMAQPAFAAMGFTIIEHQTVQIDGEAFDRAEMQKLFPISQ